MTSRADAKQDSLNRILGAGAVRIRTEGLNGAAIAPVMQDAGLTHGAFYAHFANKDELATASFRQALADNRPRWIGKAKAESWAERIKRLAKRYLTPAHRDDLASACALAALVSDAGRADPAFQRGYQEELLKSLAAIAQSTEGEDADKSPHFDDAIAFMALCVGGIGLARAVTDPTLSERILEVCRNAAVRAAKGAKKRQTHENE